jgi:hypothetical protein
MDQTHRWDVSRLVWANTHPGRAVNLPIPNEYRRHNHRGFMPGYDDKGGGPPPPATYRNHPLGEWDDPTWIRATVDLDHMTHADHIAGVAVPHDYHHKPMRPPPPPKPTKPRRLRVIGYQVARPLARGGLAWWDAATPDDDQWRAERDDAYLFADRASAQRIADSYEGIGAHVVTAHDVG